MVGNLRMSRGEVELGCNLSKIVTLSPVWSGVLSYLSVKEWLCLRTVSREVKFSVECMLKSQTLANMRGVSDQDDQIHIIMKLLESFAPRLETIINREIPITALTGFKHLKSVAITGDDSSTWDIQKTWRDLYSVLAKNQKTIRHLSLNVSLEHGDADRILQSVWPANLLTLDLGASPRFTWHIHQSDRPIFNWFTGSILNPHTLRKLTLPLITVSGFEKDWMNFIRKCVNLEKIVLPPYWEHYWPNKRHADLSPALLSLPKLTHLHFRCCSDPCTVHTVQNYLAHASPESNLTWLTIDQASPSFQDSKFLSLIGDNLCNIRRLNIPYSHNTSTFIPHLPLLTHLTLTEVSHTLNYTNLRNLPSLYDLCLKSTSFYTGSDTFWLSVDQQLHSLSLFLPPKLRIGFKCGKNLLMSLKQVQIETDFGEPNNIPAIESFIKTCPKIDKVDIRPLSISF